MRQKLLALLVCVVAGNGPALASPISISGTSSDPRFIASTRVVLDLRSETAICLAFGLPLRCLSGADLLYKSNSSNGSEDGLLEHSYSTVFTGEPNGGTITYVPGGDFAGCPSCYLIVKDGLLGNPAQFLFSLNAVTLAGGTVLPAWDGTSAITLSGFWAGPGVRGDISSVAIWGNTTRTPVVSVPDGGSTAALLGLVLVGLGVLRRCLPFA